MVTAHWNPSRPRERGWRPSPGTALISIFSLIVLGCSVFVVTRPTVANHFGYALPIANGLPCRIHHGGRDYQNGEQCAGIDRTAWSIWYSAKHHLAAGGPCQGPGSLRQVNAWPLYPVAGIDTLFGPSHAVAEDRGEQARPDLTPVVLWVRDGTCYRPYALLGGP